MRTRFRVRRQGGRLTLDACADGDGYPEHARRAFRLRIHGAKPAELRLNGAAMGGGDIVETTEGFALEAILG